MERDLISRFLGILCQLKSLHWQTEDYSRHVAYEKIYNELEELIDNFIETYQARYKRIFINSSIELINVDGNIINFIEENIFFLTDELPQKLTQRDVDLLAIRDEMVGKFYKLKYLLTLK